MIPWQQVLKESLRTREQLEDFFQHPFPATPYPLSIPLRIAEKIKRQGWESPLGLQYLPHDREGNEGEGGLKDPIGDNLRRTKEGVIHRYPNRILVSPTPLCPVQCRYCFRKNNLRDDATNYRNSTQSMESYLSSHPKINEVILTGGDPLMVTDHILREYLRVIAKFPQVKFLRLHSRTPLTIPERLTPSLVKLFKHFHQHTARVNLVIHINHWSEMDDDILHALQTWQEANLPLLAQSVLLKNVNDKTEALYELFFNLASHGIRPYYLHHPDPTQGAMHFFLPLERGRRLYHPLRQTLPGWALPHYVIDDPEGRGKVLAGNPSPSFTKKPTHSLIKDETAHEIDNSLYDSLFY